MEWCKIFDLRPKSEKLWPKNWFSCFWTQDNYRKNLKFWDGRCKAPGNFWTFFHFKSVVWDILGMGAESTPITSEFLHTYFFDKSEKLFGHSTSVNNSWNLLDQKMSDILVFIREIFFLMNINVFKTLFFFLQYNLLAISP